jgi:hypothetical protein
MQKTEWIYESPDRGDTVYRRRANSTERELVLKKEKDHPIADHMQDIVAESPFDPALKEMLDKLQVYWSLRNAND